MRLIDADKLVDLIDAEIPQDGEDDYTNGLAKAMEIILKMYFDKSVDAIPIEWIEQWLDRVTGTQDGDDISKYHDLVKGGILFINMLERDWEKENDISQ